MLSASILFISGGILLYFVNEKKAVQVAEDIDTQQVERPINCTG